jgi:hypothetical protein
MLLIVPVLLLTALLVGAPGAAAGTESRAPSLDPTASTRATDVLPPEIVGMVRLRGCTADAAGLELIARALTFVAPGRSRFVPGPNGAPHIARFEPTMDPRVVSFSILGLHPGGLYRLGVRSNDACGKIFWRGPFEGLAVAGGPSVSLEGLAARTTVEVLQRGEDQWLGTDGLLLLNHDASRRRLRWRSTLPGVVGGELQVSLTRFPTGERTAPCLEPADGIVYRRDVPASDGGWVGIGPVDFAQILSPRRAPEIDVTSETRVTTETFRSLVSGAPIYVRVVPITATGPACDTDEDGVAGWVLLGNVPDQEVAIPGGPLPAGHLGAGDGNSYAPPYTGGEAEGHPTYDELAFKIIKSHKLPATTCDGSFSGIALLQEDPLGCLIVNAGWREPGSVIDGGWFYFTPASSSGGGGGLDPIGDITNAVTSFATGFVSAAGLLVDTASEAFEEIKAEAAKVALKVISLVPGAQDACDALAKYTPTSCKSLIETGITLALASVGIPPSIPNWDELQKQGIKYAASEIATEIADETGGVVPQEVSQEVLEQMAQKALEEMSTDRGGPGSQYDWVIRYPGFEPAALTVSLRRTGTDPLPPRLELAWPKTPLFRGGWFDVPRVFVGGDELKIPIVLDPNLDSIPAPHCFSSPYQDPFAQCFGLLPPGSPPICEGKGNIGAEKPNQVYDCSISNYPAIYYRDRWVQERLNAVSGCTGVAASTKILDVATNPFDQFSFDISLDPPPLDWRYLLFASVRPRIGAIWDGPLYNAC